MSRSSHTPGPRREADARLIAAAPDLLAACLAMLATWGGQDEEIINLSRDMARAAIDKALGTEDKK